MRKKERKGDHVCRTSRRRKQIRRRPVITIRGTQDPLMNEQYSDQVEKHHHHSRHPCLTEKENLRMTAREKLNSWIELFSNWVSYVFHPDEDLILILHRWTSSSGDQIYAVCIRNKVMYNWFSKVQQQTMENRNLVDMNESVSGWKQTLSHSKESLNIYCVNRREERNTTEIDACISLSFSVNKVLSLSHSTDRRPIAVISSDSTALIYRY